MVMLAALATIRANNTEQKRDSYYPGIGCGNAAEILTPAFEQEDYGRRGRGEGCVEW